MPIGAAVALGAGSFLGSVFGGRKAARAQSRAARRAAEIQWRMYMDAVARMQPWLEAGGWAVEQLRGRLAAFPGRYEESPGYRVQLEEALRRAERAAGSLGMRRSGATLKALTDYARRQALADYDRFIGRQLSLLAPYQSLAGLGQTTAQQAAAVGSRTGLGMGEAYIAGGRAKASAYTVPTAALQQSLGDIGYYMGMREAMRRLGSVGENTADESRRGTGGSFIPLGLLEFYGLRP